jgi:pimeloyl-ACP methyl ester carboxylesterase
MSQSVGPEVNRRHVIGTLAAATAANAAATATPALAQVEQKTFVLVHGGWRGGWCWRRVSDQLEKKGHKVFTPTLTGLGERSHLLAKGINLQTHTTDIVNVVKYERLNNIVLVGHSYAGLVITPAAEQIGPQIASIVFLDAFLPQVGESAMTTASQTSQDAIKAAVERGEIFTKPLPASLFGDNEKDRPWIDGLSTPHPILTLTDSCVATDAREKIAKKTYIRALRYNNPAFNNALARTKADKTWRTYELDSGHDVMADMPDRLVEILLEVA